MPQEKNDFIYHVIPMIKNNTVELQEIRLV